MRVTTHPVEFHLKCYVLSNTFCDATTDKVTIPFCIQLIFSQLVSFNFVSIVSMPLHSGIDGSESIYSICYLWLQL